MRHATGLAKREGLVYRMVRRGKKGDEATRSRGGILRHSITIQLPSLFSRNKFPIGDGSCPSWSASLEA